MPVPTWTYTYTAPKHGKAVSVPSMLREWHRAMLLGMELQSVQRDGVPVDPVRVMMLNLWVSAWGGWNASRQDYFESWKRLENVLSGPPPKVVKRRRRKVDQAGP